MATSKTPKREEVEYCPQAYGYVRVSTEEQVEEGISLRVQRARIRAFAEAYGLILGKIYADEGISGSTLNRPGLQALLEKVGTAECDTIIIYKLSRLSRRTRDLLFLIEDVFVKGRSRLVSITEQIDTDTVMGRFFLTIMAALAQMERELIAERTKAVLQYKKEQGELVGTVPYGYKLGKGEKLVVDSKEMSVVRKILKWQKDGVSYGKIASSLNENKVPTKRGGKWYPSTVRYIVTNTLYRKKK